MNIYAFDIDGVLCDTKEAHRAELERHFGVTFTDGPSYAHFGFHHDDEAVMAELGNVALDLWRRPTVCANGEASGQAVIRTLGMRRQFAGYVTRRHPSIEGDTRDWLLRHRFPQQQQVFYKNTQPPITKLSHPLVHMLGDTESKAQSARNLGATHLVEDSASEALKAAQDGLDVVVVRRPYNAAFEREINEGVHYPPATVTFIDELSDLL